MDTKPDPDPTVLTTAQLEKAIENVTALFGARFDGLENVASQSSSRIDGVPLLIKEAVDHLREVTDEQFRGIKTQFQERDVRTENDKTQSQKAIDAALQAQEKAVGKQNDNFTQSVAKSEDGYTKQIDGMGLRLDDLKTRFATVEANILSGNSRVEGRSRGADATWAYVVGGIGILAVVVDLVSRIPHA